MHAVIWYLAGASASPSPGSGVLNISGLTTFVGSVAGLAVAIAGIAMMIRVHGQRNMPQALASGAVLLLGLAVFGLSLSGNTDGLATALAHLIFR